MPRAQESVAEVGEERRAAAKKEKKSKGDKGERKKGKVREKRKKRGQQGEKTHASEKENLTEMRCQNALCREVMSSQERLAKTTAKSDKVNKVQAHVMEKRQKSQT